MILLVLAYDFIGAILFISLNSEVKCNSTVVSEEDITSSFFWHIKVYLVGCMSYTQYVHTYQSTYITESFTKLSWTLDKVDENELNLTEKYVCTASDLHNCFRTSDGNRLRFILFTKSSDDKLRRLPSTNEALQLDILRSVQAACRIWDVTLQSSDQIPSLVDCRWKYFKGKRIAVDWCGVYVANLNDYIFSCTSKRLCIRCKSVNISSLPLCSCVWIAKTVVLYSTRENLQMCSYISGVYVLLVYVLLIRSKRIVHRCHPRSITSLQRYCTLIINFF